MVAALSADRKTLLVSVVNATESEQAFDLNINGTQMVGAGKMLQLTGATPDAINRVGQTPQLAVKETAIGGSPTSITVSPISITLYEFPVAEGSQ
jgi:alpha-N-arabinofuranosidase